MKNKQKLPPNSEISVLFIYNKKHTSLLRGVGHWHEAVQQRELS